MGFKSFRFQVILRVILLAGSIFILSELFHRTNLYFTMSIVALIIVLQILNIIRFLEKTNRGLARFLKSIKYSDFTQSFSTTTKGSAFEELNAAFEEVISEFQNARMEKEEHYRYLQTIVHHVGIGLIAYDQTGTVDLINNSAKRQLKIAALNNINKLEGFRSGLGVLLNEIKPGERKLFKMMDGEDIYQLIVYATGFMLRHQNYRLVSLQNIQIELEEKEMEAWQKLIRVLTHEIMNSITPISSLSATAHSLLKSQWDSFEKGENAETLIDVKDAVSTIENRSKGLLEFVQSYRSLTHIPRPEYEIISVNDLFNGICSLLKPSFEELKVSCGVLLEPATMKITADPRLTEQVIINIVKNAVEAVRGQEKPEIGLSGAVDESGRPVLQIWDNGPGINPDVLEQIFIPFFTTKSEGSGIGLAFSRQVMRLHGGTLSVKSEPNVKTIFTLRF